MSKLRQSKPFLAYVLFFVTTLFIGLLVFIYIASERANPVLLDEHGNPVVSTHSRAQPQPQPQPRARARARARTVLDKSGTGTGAGAGAGPGTGSGSGSGETA
jgi:hypothetical protein